MDMYQKREQRKNKTVEENTTKININWDISAYAETHLNPYKISIF